MPAKKPKELTDEALRLYTSGLSSTEVSAALGGKISNALVCQIARQHGVARGSGSTKHRNQRRKSASKAVCLSSIPEYDDCLSGLIGTLERGTPVDGRPPGFPNGNGITDKDRYLIVKLYQAGEKITAIAPTIGCGTSTVHRVIHDAGVSRPFSERKAMFCVDSPIGTYGRKSTIWIDKAGGFIKADSTFEVARLLQLQADPSVKSVSRCKIYLKYSDAGTERHYTPDFSVVFEDGSMVIEEIKPAKHISSPTNISKFAVARAIYGPMFKVVTEAEIGHKWLRLGLGAVDASDSDAVKLWRREKRLAQRRAAQRTYNKKIKLAKEQ